MIRDGSARESTFDLRIRDNPPGIVERRHLTADELAAIRAMEPPDPAPVIYRESREPKARVYVHRHPNQNVGGKRAFTDMELFVALVDADGRQNVAAETLGVHRSTVKNRLRSLRNSASLPDDVLQVLRGPGGHWRWDKAA